MRLATSLLFHLFDIDPETRAAKSALHFRLVRYRSVAEAVDVFAVRTGQVNQFRGEVFIHQP